MIGALAVKATVALIAALLIVASLRRARASMRHLVLAATFAFVLLLPAVQRFVPRWAIEVAETTSAPVAVLVERSPYEVAPEQSTPTSRVVHIDWVRVYGAGVVAMLAWLAIGVWRLRRLE